MKYVSTRTGSGPDAPAVGFLQAILSGLAPYGGLYVPETWPEPTFTHAATCPLKQLAPGLFTVELFHGPSLAFKDVAMQLLGRLYDYALAKHGRTMTGVCATSGGTGGAV